MKSVIPSDFVLSLLKEVLSYDEAIGQFTWKVHRTGTATIGDVAGSKDKDGYIRISFNQTSYRAHNIAWFFYYGEWPNNEIDHINRKVDDNRICNLRLATRTQNSMNRRISKNNTTGFKGVHYEAGRKKYRATIKINGNSIKLGRFDTAEQAYLAYKNAAEINFGEYANAESNIISLHIGDKK